MVFLPWYGGKLSRQCSRKNPPPHLLTKNKQSLRSHLLKLKDLQQQKGSVQLNNRLTQKAVSGHCLFVPQRSDCKHRNYSFTRIQIQIWQLKDVKCASALIILCFLGCLCVWRIWKISATEAIVSRFLKQWLLHLNLNVFLKEQCCQFGSFRAQFGYFLFIFPALNVSAIVQQIVPVSSPVLMIEADKALRSKGSTAETANWFFSLLQLSLNHRTIHSRELSHFKALIEAPLPDLLSQTPLWTVWLTTN